MSKYNAEKKEYVALLDKALKPLVDFGSVKYLNVHSTGQEFLKFNDSMGGARFMDVTALDTESILLETMALLVGHESNRIIKGKESRRKVAELFAREDPS